MRDGVKKLTVKKITLNFPCYHMLLRCDEHYRKLQPALLGSIMLNCEMAYACQVEVAGWLGADFVKSMVLDKMPDAMRKDTEELVDVAASGPRKQPQRYTRKEAARRANAAAPSAPSAGPAAALAGAPSAATGMEGDDMVVYQCPYVYKYAP